MQQQLLEKSGLALQAVLQKPLDPKGRSDVSSKSTDEVAMQG